MRRILVFDSGDNYLFDIDPTAVLSAVTTEEINGTNSLSISTLQTLYKSYRLLVSNATGAWSEYVVTNDSAQHDAGDRAAYGTYHAVQSAQYDLITTYGEDIESGGEQDVGPAVAMANALNGTSRWTVGTVTVTGSATIEMFGNSAWERLQDVVKTYGGELQQQVTVGFNKITGRQLNLLSQMGQQVATRRFEWRRDLTQIKRKATDAPYFCRMIPVGKSDDVTIEDLNDGVRWLQDDVAAQVMRVPDGSGGWEYPTQKVKFSDIDDDRELLSYSTEHLYEYTRPSPTYEATVLQYAEAGMDHTGVALGDVVQADDYWFSSVEPLKFSARVHRIVRNLLDETDMTVTIGDIGETFALTLQRMDTTLSRVKNSLDATFGASLTSTEVYVDWLTDQMNNFINALGGWTYIVQGRGIVTYSCEVSDPEVGAEAKAQVATGNGSVTEIRGGTIRFANSLTPSGDWDYKTVIVSGHIATDLVTAAHLVSGYIGSAASGNYWNLDTGELRMASTSTFGDRTVSQALSAIDATISGVAVEYAESQSPSNPPAETSSDWQTTPPDWREGYYIWQRTATTNASGTTHSDPVMISGKNGKGISSTEVKYAVANSASGTIAESEWQTTAPTSIANGKWLWTRTVTTYTDGTTSTAYSKSYVGTNGANATVYQAIPAENIIIRKQGGGTLPQTITCNGYSTQGNQIQTSYAGRFVIQEGRRQGSFINPVYSTVYTSSANESRCVYNINQSLASSVINYKISLYAAGGTSTLLDSVIVPVIGNGNGVYSIEVKYGTSAASDTQPTSWSDSPTVAQGAWLWTRTVTTYTDGTTTTAYSKGYSGTDGSSVSILGSYNTLADLQTAHPTGSLGDAYIVAGDLYVWNGSAWEDVGQIQGPAGDSVTVSAIEYATNDGSSTPSSSDWSATMPASVAQGNWLWVRTTYSDSSEAVTKTYMGTDGADGSSVFVRSASKDQSTGITTVILEESDGGQTTLTIADGEDGDAGVAGAAGYVHTAWANSADGQTDFSTSVSANKRYLGVYTDNTQADSSSPSAYSWSLIKGTDGGDAYTVVLTNESHTFAAGETAAIAGSTRCDVVAYKGTTQVAATIGTISGKPTGMTTSISGNGTTGAYFTVNVTSSLTTRSGTLVVPVTVDGKSFSKRFSWSLALKGEDGVTISTVQYATTESPSTAPSSSDWSTTAPTSIDEGKWLWVKTTYSDGSDATAKSYIGTDGADGKSTYLQNVSRDETSRTTTMTIATYNPATDTTTTEDIVIADGADGDDGVAGLNGYVHTAWANSSDGATDFSTSVSANKKYLGVYTDNSVGDSQRYQDYSWSLIKGATGDAGRGASKIEPQYHKYYSDTNPPPSWSSSWSTEEPTWSSGMYIWTRSKMTWDDGSSPTYTDPVLAKGINSANETAKQAKDAVDDLDDSLTQEEIFNRLTNDGQTQGIYLQDGRVYINGTYIQAGTINANLIRSGTLSGVKVQSPNSSTGNLVEMHNGRIAFTNEDSESKVYLNGQFKNNTMTLGIQYGETGPSVSVGQSAVAMFYNDNGYGLVIQNDGIWACSRAGTFNRRLYP